MAQDPEEALPPYFGISPDEALRELDPPVGTRDFAAIAGACVRGREDLAGRGHEAGGRKTLRLFSTWEITRYLIPVAPAHFRRVLRANPTLPQGRTETEGGAKWFTLDEVLRLRAHFAAEGSRAKPYLPGARPGCPPRSRRSPTSRAGSARPRWRRTSPCRRRSTATGCWWSTSTARAR